MNIKKNILLLIAVFIVATPASALAARYSGYRNYNNGNDRIYVGCKYIYSPWTGQYHWLCY